MKITEPKTPYAKQYNPAEDEEEIEMLNAEELNVDELDDKSKTRRPKIDDIPDFDLGEPELVSRNSHTPESEKRVVVEPDAEDAESGHNHGEELPHMTPEEREKHIKFEEMRKKHYEMKNVKDLLGYECFFSPINNARLMAMSDIRKISTRKTTSHQFLPVYLMDSRIFGSWQMVTAPSSR
jgi:protein phosphatase inhibitor 2